MSIFQSQLTAIYQRNLHNKLSYDDCLFYCPKVYAKDGFNISLQIHSSNYCTSENGYRELGHTFEEVEFGFPSEDDILLHPYSEMYDSSNSAFSAVGTVGRIPISILEKLFEKRGGIDWEKTISVEQYKNRVSKH
jgi:hypothetical protein